MYKDIPKAKKDTLAKYAISFKANDTICFFDWDPLPMTLENFNNKSMMRIEKRVAKLSYRLNYEKKRISIEEISGNYKGNHYVSNFKYFFVPVDSDKKKK